MIQGLVGWLNVSLLLLLYLSFLFLFLCFFGAFVKMEVGKSWI